MIEKLPQFRNDCGIARPKPAISSDPDKQHRDPLEPAGEMDAAARRPAGRARFRSCWLRPWVSSRRPAPGAGFWLSFAPMHSTLLK